MDYQSRLEIKNDGFLNGSMRRGTLSGNSIGYVLLVFCSLSLWIGQGQFRGALKQPASFSRVRGTITTSQIDSHRRRNRSKPWSFEKETVYNYDIRYQYKVRGSLYDSDRVNFDLPQSHADPSLARSYIRKYAVGKSVWVFYQPDDPEFSVLEPANKGRSLIVLVIVGSLWAVGLALVLTSHFKQLIEWREYRTDKSKQI